jgi:hypothetical protein
VLTRQALACFLFWPQLHLQRSASSLALKQLFLLPQDTGQKTPSTTPRPHPVSPNMVQDLRQEWGRGQRAESSQIREHPVLSAHVTRVRALKVPYVLPYPVLLPTPGVKQPGDLWVPNILLFSLDLPRVCRPKKWRVSLVLGSIFLRRATCLLLLQCNLFGLRYWGFTSGSTP